MKNTKFARILSFVLCLVLVAAMSLLSVGCNDNNTPASAGEKEFTLTVTHSDSSEKTFTVKSEKQTVGEALLDEEIIAGSQGQYGLMVETVDGETVKYDDNGKYWAFYIDGEYAMSGVDTTNIEDGQTYAFKVE